MTRLRGRALGGQRLLARIPHGHYQTSTLSSGIRLQGPCAPWLFEGPLNGEMFWAWVRQGLAPALRPGEVVILDNLADGLSIEQIVRRINRLDLIAVLKTRE